MQGGSSDFFSLVFLSFRTQSHFPKIHGANGTSPKMNTFNFHPTTFGVVGEILKNIKPNKAQGYDLIPPSVVKASYQTIARPLSNLINTVITRSEVPDTWKHGQITPLHKKDSVLDKANYRPVTVLPVFGKVFERIAHMQMSDHFEPIFHKYVFAYRKFHGCSTALLTLTEQWKEELDRHKVIGAVAMDLSKAFDCLPHDLILEKLEFYGLSAKSISLLRSYLSSRYQRVKLGNTFSSWIGVSAGVPQGSILGPLLFNIFMNDLVYTIENSKMLNYADDTKIYLSHSEPQFVEGGINRDLESARLWFKENGMMPNPKKYQAIVLGRKGCDINFQCANETIPTSNEINLLGVTLDSKLKFDAHVASVCRKVGGQVNALNRLQNILPCKVKELMYRAFVLPHFHYCSQVWHHCGSRNTKKIEKVNERALRYVYKDKTSAYHELLQRIGLGTTLENRRVQDMLITINACFQGTAPTCIKDLVKMRNNKYDLRGNNTLSLPKVNTTKYGLNSFRYFAAKQWNNIPNELRLRAGGLEFNKQVRNIQF